MKILLQERTTLQFYEAVGRWTVDEKKAMHFRHAANAIQFCRQWKIANAQILIRSRMGEPDLILPVDIQ